VTGVGNRGVITGVDREVVARHTREFDDQAAWLVTHTSKTAVMELMRVTWRTVGAIAARGG